MGTSGTSKGPASGTSLVPSWLDEPTVSPLPGAEGDTSGDDDTGGQEAEQTQSPDDVSSKPAILPPPVTQRFQSARSNFSRYAKSGGTDYRALRRSIRDYVRSGTRGSANATRRMGASRIAANGALAVLRDFQKNGVENTLRSLNFNQLVGRPTEEIFLGLTEAICKDGGSIDEAIARDAWLETITELDSFGVVDLEALTSDQVREVFLSFVAHSIETRLFQDIGIKGFQVAGSNAEIRAFETQFRSYIQRAVRDSFSEDFDEFPTFSDEKLSEIIDKTYKEAWDILVVWGDSVE